MKEGWFMFYQKTFSYLIILFFVFLSLSSLKAQVLVVGDSSMARVDSLSYETDDVVVTATRVEKKIIDIPYPVIRINNTQYEYARRVTLGDVVQNVPGLFLQNRYGNHDVRVSIRGFGSRSNSGIRGVRILLDGIPESEPDGQTRIEAIDFNSVGSIEIVKGNASSLYTNAPGGVINFINDINFPYSFVTQFNDFGSYELHQNGIKFGVRTDKYGFLGTYSYHNYQGYRPHSQDYWNIFNTVVDLLPGDGTNLKVLGYFVDGLIKLPGSLTLDQYNEDPYQANQRDVDRDTKRITKKGRVGLLFNTDFGGSKYHVFEIVPYGTIKYFERTSAEYRIIDRYGIGSSLKYIYKGPIGKLDNEFSIGGDVLYQTGPVAYFNNIGGTKGDNLTALVNDDISNYGIYFSENLELYNNQLYMLLTGRYDNIYFQSTDQLLNSRSNSRSFNQFTPKLALNYKLTQSVAIYTSYGYSFDSPAGNELDNYDRSKLLNPDLNAQKSGNFEIGIKGNLIYPYNHFFNNIIFEATFFNIMIDDEIIPFEVYGDVFYRNAAKTNRTGLEIGGSVDIVNGLNLQLSYAYSNFVYDEYIATTITIDLDTLTRDFSGNIPPSIPDNNLFAALSYTHNLTQQITGFLRGSVRYVSGMFVDDANSAKTEGYTTLNAGIGFDMIFGKFNILLSGGLNNILDEVYVGFININSSNGQYYEAGEPLYWYAGLNLGYTF
jgi:iron complex outermembrane receptor protein